MPPCSVPIALLFPFPCVQVIFFADLTASRRRSLVSYISGTEERWETDGHGRVRVVTVGHSVRAHFLESDTYLGECQRTTPACHHTPKVKRLSSIRLCQWNAPAKQSDRPGHRDTVSIEMDFGYRHLEILNRVTPTS